MRRKLIRIVAAILLAVRRILARQAVTTATDHDYGHASILGCVGIRTLVAAWTDDPTDWYEDPSMDFALDVPGVGRFRLFDPSSDEQLGSGYIVLSLNNKQLLRQRSNSTLGALNSAIHLRIRYGFNAALESWLIDNSEWTELGHSVWPRGKARKFQLEHDGGLLPQDRSHGLYQLHVDPLRQELHLARNGCIWFRGDDPRVQQLYSKLCQRPELAT